MGWRSVYLTLIMDTWFMIRGSTDVKMHLDVEKRGVEMMNTLNSNLWRWKWSNVKMHYWMYGWVEDQYTWPWSWIPDSWSEEVQMWKCILTLRNEEWKWWIHSIPISEDENELTSRCIIECMDGLKISIPDPDHGYLIHDPRKYRCENASWRWETRSGNDEYTQFQSLKMKMK